MKNDAMAPDWGKKDDREIFFLPTGAGEAIDLIAELTDRPLVALFLVEQPTLTESLLTFRKQGALCIGVPSDNDGIIPEALEDILKRRDGTFPLHNPKFSESKRAHFASRTQKGYTENC